MNGFDLSTVTNIYLGSTTVKEVYMGTKLIWSKTIDYSNEYFTIESLEDANKIGIVDSDRPSISISTDKQTWTTVTPNAAPTYFITLNAGEKVYIKGSNNAYNNDPWSAKDYFTSTGRFNVSGNIMSLIYADDFKNKTTLSSSNNYAFTRLFCNANKLISAEHLVLPATTLANYCYYSMFSGCSSLTTAPELPATILADYCYEYMFASCSSLTTAPELPATTLADSCYFSMFSGCWSLTTAPELPATTLASNCYYGMFSGCSSLTTAPELPATTLAYGCYSYMFSVCSSLTTAPELPAYTLYDGCYSYMFSGCSSLTTAPYLHATWLSSNCYGHMFEGCSSLTEAPYLPATEVVSECYSYMFSSCSSLTTAPELPATTLVYGCYQYMFQDCLSLNYIKMLATDVSATDCLTGWVSNVASSGTIVYASSTTLPIGENGIPSGWSIELV